MRDERIPRRFGQWAGNPKGAVEDRTRCVEEVWPERGVAYQCLRKRGHGTHGAYCKQHARRHPAAAEAQP